jgi:DUF438 domain-containing protein
MTEVLRAKAERQRILKEIIRDLHRGAGFDEVKARFERLIENVSPSEIAEMEDALIQEGMPVAEVKRLCHVHTAVFRDALARQEPVQVPPGHPVHTFQLENQAAGRLIAELRTLIGGADLPATRQAIRERLERLGEMEKHYLRKEYQLFPILERRGIAGPPKVMWGIHDQIRGMLKEVRALAESDHGPHLTQRAQALLDEMDGMIYKEENILFPMALQTLTEPEWREVRAGEGELGYSFSTPEQLEPPPVVPDTAAASALTPGLTLDTGQLLPGQVNLLLKHLPLDLTFVDEEDRVRYYSAGKHRVFPRSPGIIGRRVQDCHPPDSVHVVNKILEEFKQGEKERAEFWISRGGRFIYITYQAIRDDAGAYRGVLEVTQDATEVRALQGEKRLLDW